MANTKLTLSMEQELIEKAKVAARNQGLSLSKLVKRYLSQLVQDQSPEFGQDQAIPKGILKIRGMIKGVKDFSKDDLQEAKIDYLKKKYEL